jgi:hypothetical protein
MSEKIMFKTRMVEYCKNIMQQFTFDRTLFRKEYRKSLQYLNADDQLELKLWLRSNIK